MKKAVNIVYSFLNKSRLLIKANKQFYKKGGYTHYTIANIHHGEILKGKKILITGGSTGIGFSIASKCIEEGATVLITGRNEQKLQNALSNIDSSLLKYIVWDVSELSLIDSKLRECADILGGDIDILINNAGVIDTTSFPNITEGIWDKIYETNSKGLYFLTQEIYKYWLNTPRNNIKKIINMSSQGGFVGATYPYRMTKWDIAGLTQGLGVKLASEGIIVNGIAPGVIATGMQPNISKDSENIFYPNNPIERYAFPEEIAELALFLISDASNFIVGQTIICDGGYSIK